MSNGSTIITQTLPTVVGAGVVSRTTDTMFGRQKQRKVSRKRSSAAKSAANSTANKRATPKVHRGPHGGRYVIRRGRKVYITKSRRLRER